MSSFPDARPVDADLVTVQEFANQYRVDASVVRGWIKLGHIDYVLDGPRKMRKVRKSDLLKPIEPEVPSGMVNVDIEVGSDSDIITVVVDAGRPDTATAGTTVSTTEAATSAPSATKGVTSARQPDRQSGGNSRSTHRR